MSSKLELFLKQETPQLTRLRVNKVALVKNPSVSRFIGVDERNKLVLGIVLAADRPDKDGEIVSAKDVEAAMNAWGEWFGNDALQQEHGGPVLKSCVPLDWGFTGNSPARLPGYPDPLPAGVWWLVVKCDPDTMTKIQAGTLTGFSIDGRCTAVKADNVEVECSTADVARFIAKTIGEALNG